MKARREDRGARRAWCLALGAWCLCALGAGAATPNVDLGAHTFVGLLKESGNRVVETPEGKSIATGQLTVGGPADVTSGVTLLMVDEERFTNPKTGETVGVPRAYLEEISPWLEFKDVTYDPWGDFDKDGVSNYSEYLAGTDPFDETHKLTISKFEPNVNGLHKITFEYVGGHLYGVAATPDLTKPAWTQRKILPTPDGVEQAAVLPSAEPDDVGITTIYVVPASDKPSEFFKLEPR